MGDSCSPLCAAYCCSTSSGMNWLLSGGGLATGACCSIHGAVACSSPPMASAWDWPANLAYLTQRLSKCQSNACTLAFAK